MTDEYIQTLINDNPYAKFGPLTQLSTGLGGHLRRETVENQIGIHLERKLYIELRDYIWNPKHVLFKLYEDLKND